MLINTQGVCYHTSGGVCGIMLFWVCVRNLYARILNFGKEIIEDRGTLYLLNSYSMVGLCVIVLFVCACSRLPGV